MLNDQHITNGYVHSLNRIDGVMVSVLASSAVDCGFESRSDNASSTWPEKNKSKNVQE
jgi:hypothetical protein